MGKLGINQKLLFEEVNNQESIIVDSDRGLTHVLNKTATILFKLCNATTIDEAIDKFANLFNGNSEEKEQIRKDALEQINAFIENGLVSIVEE